MSIVDANFGQKWWRQKWKKGRGSSRTVAGGTGVNELNKYLCCSLYKLQTYFNIFVFIFLSYLCRVFSAQFIFIFIFFILGRFSLICITNCIYIFNCHFVFLSHLYTSWCTCRLLLIKSMGLTIPSVLSKWIHCLCLRKHELIPKAKMMIIKSWKNAFSCLCIGRELLCNRSECKESHTQMAFISI